MLSPATPDVAIVSRAVAWQQNEIFAAYHRLDKTRVHAHFQRYCLGYILYIFFSNVQ